MNKFLSKTKEFIFAQQTSMLSSTLIISGMMMLSRLAGFLRNRIYTSYFTKSELDVFLSAFRFPDLVFEILITGALSTTLIPFFIKYQKDKNRQNEVISTIINIIFLILIVFISILFVLMPYLIPPTTQKFTQEQIDMAVQFSRLLLLGQLPFLVLGNFLTGISQARKSFFIPAIVPVIYNFSIIICTYFFTPQLHLMAPIVGVVVGAILFFLLQLPILYSAQFSYKPIIRNIKETYTFFRTAIPRILTTVVAQIEASIDLTLANAQHLAAGSYTVFYFAQHLQLLPVSIIGIAFGQASVPYLTEIYQDKKYKEFKKIIVDSILNLLYLTIPFASFFIIARLPIVRMFFGGSKFDWNATLDTATTLSYFSISLPLHAIYYFITRCYYAIFDTKTPFYISLFSIAFNASLSYVFIYVLKLPVWYLAIAFSIAMTVQVMTLLFVLYKKIKGFDIRTLCVETIKILVATFNTSVIVYFILKVFDGLIFDTSRTINVFLLLVVCFAIYAILFLFLTWLFGIKEIYLLTKMLLKVRAYQKRVVEVYQGVE